ncbi:nef attachable domain protein, partial [Chlamydia psittaci 02DC21]
MCSVNSPLRITAFPSRGRSLRMLLWTLQRDIWKPIEAYGEKENILKGNMQRSF